MQAYENPLSAFRPVLPPHQIERPTQNQAEDDRLITAEEVRRIAGGISDMTLWRWLKRGILPPPLVIERRRYWWKEAILDALQCAGRGDARPESSAPLVSG
ncbi:hypothetical protein Thiowin_02579 [Thiorhodovibrio winogradskyi]|uniref:Helix-turn-helix domain-containing protein n=1 Tax=Thiorhodovibrio winogradskyi TaxID=77007 RepID=A0ABZ0SAJ8_9GAMM|nr:hypothetical protein [Thiorhodovibrio winogradskyi]